jgi:histidine triad (HIT) family protein
VKVAEDANTFAFMGINPLSDGHLLVVPKQHSQDLLDTPPDDLAAVMLEAQRLAKVAADALGADGVNVVNCSGAAASQSVFHFHLHVIPRYAHPSRDCLGPPWKPGVAGDAKLISSLGARLRSGARKSGRPDWRFLDS